MLLVSLPRACWFGMPCPGGWAPAPTPAPTHAKIFPQQEAKEVWGLAFAAICKEEQIREWNFVYPDLKNLFDSSPILRNFELYDVITTPPVMLFGEGIKSELQVFTGYDVVNHRHVIVFRGSENMDNWIDTNFDIWMLPYGNAAGVHEPWIHKGFLEAFQELEAAGLRRHIQSTFRRGDTVLVTGHSLGGALATVASLELKMNPIYKALGLAFVDVITYGSPRVMSPTLAKHYNYIMDSSWRVVNDNDPAVVVPPTSYNYWTQAYDDMSFYHVGTEVWCNRDGSGPENCQQCDGSGEDPNCQNIFLPHMVFDHLTYFGVIPNTNNAMADAYKYHDSFCRQASEP